MLINRICMEVGPEDKDQISISKLPKEILNLIAKEVGFSVKDSSVLPKNPQSTPLSSSKSKALKPER